MRLIVRTHDLYLASPNASLPVEDPALAGANTHTQACLYVPPPGGAAPRCLPTALRHYKLRNLVHQLHILADLVATAGAATYATSDRPSLADLTLFPTLVYADVLLRTTFGWERRLPPRLEALRAALGALPAFAAVRAEMEGALGDKDADVASIRRDVRENGRGYDWSCMFPEA